MRQATLCFLIRDNQNNKEILLALKKKGFGEGKWNGIGGKFDFKRDSSILETAIREMREEINIRIKEQEKMAILNFSYPYLESDEEKEWQVHVFFVRKWKGEPIETEEMLPKWFKISEIPYDSMWPDDKFWLPEILKGKKLKADFIFKKGENILKYNIKMVSKLS
jgi:8-oxo-dGTP pyrophosphatase MutT (NUDIX family)